MTPEQFAALNSKLLLIAAGIWTVAAWLCLESLAKLLTTIAKGVP